MIASCAVDQLECARQAIDACARAQEWVGVVLTVQWRVFSVGDVIVDHWLHEGWHCNFLHQLPERRHNMNIEV